MNAQPWLVMWLLLSPPALAMIDWVRTPRVQD